MRNTIRDYVMQIRWEPRDECFAVHFPAFPGVMADGPTPEEAAAEGRVALEGVLEMLYKCGDEIPEPDACELAYA